MLPADKPLTARVVWRRLDLQAPPIDLLDGLAGQDDLALLESSAVHDAVRAVLPPRLLALGGPDPARRASAQRPRAVLAEGRRSALAGAARGLRRRPPFAWPARGSLRPRLDRLPGLRAGPARRAPARPGAARQPAGRPAAGASSTPWPSTTPWSAPGTWWSFSSTIRPPARAGRPRPCGRLRGYLRSTAPPSRSTPPVERRRPGRPARGRGQSPTSRASSTSRPSRGPSTTSPRATSSR